MSKVCWCRSLQVSLRNSDLIQKQQEKVACTLIFRVGWQETSENLIFCLGSSWSLLWNHKAEDRLDLSLISNQWAFGVGRVKATRQPLTRFQSARILNPVSPPYLSGFLVIQFVSTKSEWTRIGGSPSCLETSTKGRARLLGRTFQI